MSELTPVPKGMCPAFYQFMGAGSPRSDSGEILMLKEPPAPTPDAKLIAAAANFAITSLLGAAAVLDDIPGKLPNARDCRQAADALAAALADHDRQPSERM